MRELLFTTILYHGIDQLRDDVFNHIKDHFTHRLPTISLHEDVDIRIGGQWWNSFWIYSENFSVTVAEG